MPTGFLVIPFQGERVTDRIAQALSQDPGQGTSFHGVVQFRFERVDIDRKPSHPSTTSKEYLQSLEPGMFYLH